MRKFSQRLPKSIRGEAENFLRMPKGSRRVLESRLPQNARRFPPSSVMEGSARVPRGSPIVRTTGHADVLAQKKTPINVFAGLGCAGIIKRM